MYAVCACVRVCVCVCVCDSVCVCVSSMVSVGFTEWRSGMGSASSHSWEEAVEKVVLGVYGKGRGFQVQNA